jgi:hypothetical protein
VVIPRGAQERLFETRRRFSGSQGADDGGVGDPQLADSCSSESTSELNPLSGSE